MAKTKLETLRESVHVVPLGGKTCHMLECRRCKRVLPDTQYLPVFGSKPKKPQTFGRSIQYLHPWCNTCRKQSSGRYASHPCYSPAIDTYFRRRIASIMKTAPARDIMVLIDKDDLLGRCLEQNNRCAITGIPMTFEMDGVFNKRTQASVDRIDSTGNYSVNNIQIVCNVVNLMKQDMNTAEFMRWCGFVLAGRKRAEDELLAVI